MNHTPGDWSFDGMNICAVTEETFPGEVGPVEPIIACLTHDMCPEQTILRHRPKEADANGHLIKASPDLYAACVLALDALNAMRETNMLPSGWSRLIIEPIERAIWKAKPPATPPSQ